jgi:septum formation protein
LDSNGRHVDRIFLASRSPRRRELLKQIAIPYEPVLLRQDLTRGNDVDESPIENEPPRDYVLRIAVAKAQIANHYLGKRAMALRPVLAADTTVVCAGRIIGKPVDRDDAKRILRELAGREHEILSAVAVCSGFRIEQALSVSRVWFRGLSEDEIRRYVATGEPLDKAGAYAIQGRAAVFVQHMEGSYSGIMGLPLAETAELLGRMGVEVM